MKRSAVISPCGLYRYRLERVFGPSSARDATLMFVMVNASTADAETDDQTIKKCVGFAERAGYGRILVGNKFAFRSKEVSGLRSARDPIGPENDAHLRAMMLQADRVVAGWGALAKLPEALRGRWKDVVRIADDVGRLLYTIGVNDDGHPKHPQMTGYDVPITPWVAPWFPNREIPNCAG